MIKLAAGKTLVISSSQSATVRHAASGRGQTTQHKVRRIETPSTRTQKGRYKKPPNLLLPEHRLGRMDRRRRRRSIRRVLHPRDLLSTNFFDGGLLRIKRTFGRSQNRLGRPSHLLLSGFAVELGNGMQDRGLLSSCERNNILFLRRRLLRPGRLGFAAPADPLAFIVIPRRPQRSPPARLRNPVGLLLLDDACGCVLVYCWGEDAGSTVVVRVRVDA